MHQHFLDVGAVGLIGRRVEPELHGADDFAVELCREQNGVARSDRACDLPEKAERLFVRERRHEADAGAARDTVDQDIGELFQRGIRDRRGERNDLDLPAHAARSSFDATVESAFSR